MISFDKDQKLFHLSGRGFSYLFQVLPQGYLRHLYYGARIEGLQDAQALFPVRACSFSPNFPGCRDNRYSPDTLSCEFSAYGAGDFRECSLIVEGADGSFATDFRYDGYELLPEKSRPDGMPGCRGGETLAVKLKDAISSLSLVLYYTVYEEEGAIVRRAILQNAGSPVRILRFMSFCSDFSAGEYERIVLNGAYASERMPDRAPLSQGIFTISSTRGASSHEHNPFFALTEKGASEESGDVYGFLLVYSGSFVMRAEKDALGGVRVTGGIGDTGFRWLLGKDESFCTPEAVLVYSGEGTGGMSRALHDLLRRRLLPQDRKEAPIVLNSWEAAGFSFDADKLSSLIRGAAELGAECFVLDDGWFGERSDDTSSLGDWTPNRKKLGGGLDAVAKLCRENGISFGIWVEPEMVSQNSELYRAHPDWCVHCKGLAPIESRNQLVLDLVNPAVREYIRQSLDKVLSSADIGYVKWDMNRNLAESISYTLPEERRAEFGHRYILALYELLEYFTQKYPNIFFLGCSGGGGRYDAGMLYYFPVQWASDNTDAADRCRIQYGGSFAYPICTSDNHVSSCPNLSTGRTTPLKTRADVASLGGFGLELDPKKLTKEENAELRGYIARQKELRALIAEGDVYRLKDPFSGNEFCMEILSKDRKAAYAVWVNFLAAANPPPMRLRFRGLDRDSYYCVEETGQKLKGDVLMNVGLPLPLPYGDFISKTFTLKVCPDGAEEGKNEH